MGVATAMGAGRRRHAAPARHGRARHARRRAVADLRAVHGPGRRADARARRQRPHGRRRISACTRRSATCPRCCPSPSGWRSPSGSARTPRVAVAWCGEGAAARGDAHEGMNLAGVRRLPVVFVIDNNQWAYSTPTHLEYAVEHLADRAAAYGFEGVVVDGTDVLAVYREAKQAIEKARAGGGPTLIESITLRMEGHAVHDDAFYVPKEQFEEWARKDPLERFRTWLRDARRPHRRRGGRDPRRREAPPQRVAAPRGGEPAARSRRRCSKASTPSPRSSRLRTTSNGREDLPAGDLRRAPPGDAARQARVRDGRGRRRLRRRVQGHRGLPRGVRRHARPRHAALGDRDRRPARPAPR